jgi:hypothetical protein
MISSDKLPSPFFIALAGIALLFAGMCLLAASQESFIRDDFAFLAYVQRPHWSWAEVYLPIDDRWWWAYRPLGMQTYFYLCFQFFGLNAFGYFVVAIALHFATGYLGYRLMLRFGFDARIAAVGGLLCISRYPAMRDIFYGSVFHYIAAIFFSLLAMLSFLDYAREGRTSKWIASVFFLFLALLCNEFPVVLPAVLFALALHTDGIPIDAGKVKQALIRSLPHWILVAIFLVYRFEIIAPVAANRAYGQSFDPIFLLTSLAEQLVLLFADSLALSIALGTFALAWALILRSEQGRSLATSWLMPLSLFCVAWMLAVMLPFAPLMVNHPRFSKPIEIPACILYAGALNVLWVVYSPGRRKLIEGLLLVLVLAALPTSLLWDRYHSPVGIHAQKLAGVVGGFDPPIPAHSRVVILYNAPGLASHAGGMKFKRETFGGTAALQAYYNDEMYKLDFHDLWKGPIEPGCANCVYLQLEPDLDLNRARPRSIRFQSPYADQPRREPKSGIP